MPKRKPKKVFDCVEFKRELQAKMEAKYKGMTLEESIVARQKWLRESNDPMAVWWRGRTESNQPGLTAKQKSESRKKR